MRNLNVPMYDPEMVRPMREELTRLGFAELRTPADVDAALAHERAPTLVVVNSVCGCAARNARPAAALAIQHERARAAPDRFAGRMPMPRHERAAISRAINPGRPRHCSGMDGSMLERATSRRNARDIAADGGASTRPLTPSP
jgi:putative YphP/YqiW family bacilliredoxin